MLAERWNTTPWDIRENATVLDILRINEIGRARDSGWKMNEMKRKMEEKHARSGRSTSRGI